MPLETADLEQIAELLNTKLTEFGTSVDSKMNAAITKRLTSAEQKILAEQNKVLEGLKKAPEAQQHAAGGEHVTSPEDNLRLKTLEAMVRESQSKIEDAEKRARAATEKNREASKRAKIAELLTKAGVSNPVVTDLGVGYIVDSAKLVEYQVDDEDNDHLIFKDENGQPVELQTGFNAWLKTDTAKHLLPPKGTRGSGSTQTAGGAARAPSKEDALFESLRNGLKNLG